MLSRALQSLSLAELQAERSACITALLTLAKGQRAETVTVQGPNGRSTTWAHADQARLEALIADLDAAIRAKESGAPVRRPVHPVF